MEGEQLLQAWENYRAEIQGMEARLAKLAASFLELGAYEDAAKCAIKADGARWMIARMPSRRITTGKSR